MRETLLSQLRPRIRPLVRQVVWEYLWLISRDSSETGDLCHTIYLDLSSSTVYHSYTYCICVSQVYTYMGYYCFSKRQKRLATWEIGGSYFVESLWFKYCYRVHYNTVGLFYPQDMDKGGGGEVASLAYEGSLVFPILTNKKTHNLTICSKLPYFLKRRFSNSFSACFLMCKLGQSELDSSFIMSQRRVRLLRLLWDNATCGDAECILRIFSLIQRIIN